MQTKAFERLATAVAAIAGGSAVVLCDDTAQPVRGDLVYAADRASTELTAFVVRHTSGFLQVALDVSRCDELGITAQSAADGTDATQCVTVDAKHNIGTGISAADRAMTARLLGSEHATADSFTRPGHVVPMAAPMNRPVRQYGFAESAIRLACDAGRSRAAVMSTVVGTSDPTTIADGRELADFADLHGLALVSIRDLAEVHTDPWPPVMSLHLCAGTARLFCVDGIGDDPGFICLILGDITNRPAVPLYLVDAERILHEAVMDASPPCILLGAPGGSLVHQQRLASELQRPGSQIRDLLRGSGVRSVRLSPTGQS
jgi:3,4-dihydroxy-2-butanone 4-phosphate synthase